MGWVDSSREEHSAEDPVSFHSMSPALLFSRTLLLTAPALVLPFCTSALSLFIIFPSPGFLVTSRFRGNEKVDS